MIPNRTRSLAGIGRAAALAHAGPSGSSSRARCNVCSGSAGAILDKLASRNTASHYTFLLLVIIFYLIGEQHGVFTGFGSINSARVRFGS